MSSYAEPGARRGHGKRTGSSFVFGPALDLLSFRGVFLRRYCSCNAPGTPGAGHAEGNAWAGVALAPVR